MSEISDKVVSAIGARIQAERIRRGWSIAELAARSGVSKAMVSAIERGANSPTATLLVRIAASFDLTLSALIARAELGAGGLLKSEDQPVWQDPETGYVRRHLSPPSDMPLELIRVELPAGARVAFPARAYAFNRHQIWLLSGALDFTEGPVIHHMAPGDCLTLGAPQDCVYHAPGPDPGIYLVAVLRSGA
ncbi:helix-turn-helix domain-containing protein [Methylovirgula sp. 4M-Z18]|uniref:helix-turn-helix domain-containing protein n=1 Tax=Methylovirgula sp. 4M-Z18 TaxID=2293567 RepID=UPI000E2F33F5|nr:XRE family transcriptional regulator [Methylovirgula sp. 4M-Z18]RFB80087.1 XRE family transcriptional regulator [Methylovirgula sp. 4M-Z18]